MTNILCLKNAAQFCHMKNGKQCFLCASVCPAEKLKDLENVSCLKCGLCAAACPIRAIPAGVDNNDTLRWGKELEGKTLHLLCPMAGIQEGSSPILQLSSCAFALLTETFFALRAMGVKKILLELGQCETCLYSFEKIFLYFNAITKLFPDWIIIKQNCTNQEKSTVKITSIKARPVYRRNLFHLFLESTEDVFPYMSESASCHNQNQSKLSFIPRHLALYALQILIKKKELSPTLVLEPSLFPTYCLMLLNECNACEVCSRICPSKALTIQKTQKNISLHYDSGKCLGCKLCVKMCKMNSLHMVGIENSIANLLDTDNAIFTSDILYCTRCKSSFIGSGEYCATCFNREQLF